ncbi:MAG: QueG-associated DUF1730 domain-containing protein, partial [Eikenella corrodens]
MAAGVHQAAAHKGHANLSRYTWSTDYHLVINEYLERLIERLQII